MAELVWDTTGSRFYETGLDRGVLYTEDGLVVPWNGITSVTEKVSGNEASAIYFDGSKIYDSVAPGEFSGVLRAYTYPDELLEAEGTVLINNGLHIANQKPKRFGLSYRTKVNEGPNGEVGYKIHVLYNLLAIPSQRQYFTESNVTQPMEFEWTLISVPSEIPGYRPTSHLIFDTRDMSSSLIADIESTLYGNLVDDPRLPEAATLVGFISRWVILRITDNLDGTWTATGPDSMISMLDATTFQIMNANAEFVDANTYNISDSTF